MHFRRQPQRDRPEVNLIAFIDVLLVVMIFLMASTTFQRFGALQLSLPQAASKDPKSPDCVVAVAVAADGRLTVQRSPVPDAVGVLAAALADAARGDAGCQIEVHADALATHQSVVRVMQAAQQAGLPTLSFSTRSQANE